MFVWMNAQLEESEERYDREGMTAYRLTMLVAAQPDDKWDADRMTEEFARQVRCMTKKHIATALRAAEANPDSVVRFLPASPPFTRVLSQIKRLFLG